MKQGSTEDSGKKSSKAGIASTLRPETIACRDMDLDCLLGLEWLRTNRLGAYSSSTVIGCNVRRYHGLLVAAANPPVGRIVALSTIMEQLIVGEKIYDLATNEFADSFGPRGLAYMEKFQDDTAATFIYKIGDVVLKKRVLLSDTSNVVAVRYELTGKAAKLLLRPFTPMRDFHSLRRFSQPVTLQSEPVDGGVKVEDQSESVPPVFLTSDRAEFRPDEQWWYRVRYRIDMSRGQDGFEDLYSPGLFVWSPGRAKTCQVVASLAEPEEIKFQSVLTARRKRQAEFVAPFAKSKTPRAVKQLAAATEAFGVHRPAEGGRGLSILAGYPWFADWGRDAFIALPGLLLTTGQFQQARTVFRTFIERLSEGMIPNRFDDFSGAAHYNSIDASLWFILAAERYIHAADDDVFCWEELLPACREILRCYTAGTRFGIGAADDGLLVGGSDETQLTWMDAKLGQTVITSRAGKAVEVNALWYCAHRILADRLAVADKDAAAEYAGAAETIGEAFVKTFWNEQFGWLNDCVGEHGPDASLRPNQIFAVSLPHSPLDAHKQRTVVKVVQENLLTPFGLRTLSPADPRYRRRYGGSWESRDRAYHQGTVWAWLIGPFIEAYLKVEGPAGAAQAKKWLAGFDGHLKAAGLGSVSEIFDGDAPHTPRGCFAQAWSVAEVLRAKMLVAEYEKHGKS
jgi:predicted glycogen debranching enzyme